MGGKSSGATSETRHIYAESASFDAVKVRKTSQRLGIRTDSSMRFEKGVDRLLPHTAQTRYTELLSYFVENVQLQKQSIITQKQNQTVIEISHDFITRKI
jgi:phenylalanyl-tRNA synthetase beta chain